MTRTPFLTASPSLSFNHSSNHSSATACVASNLEYFDFDGICTINGTTCADRNGKFPCACAKYYSQILTSSVIAPLYTHTWVDIQVPSSCDGYRECFDSSGDITDLVTSTVVQTEGGGLVPQSYYSGQAPPAECSDGCDVEATRVRILFWPVDDNSTTLQNVTKAAELIPYTTVSDGFTL